MPEISRRSLAIITYRQFLAIQQPLAQIPVSDITMRRLLEYIPPPGKRLIDSKIAVPVDDYRVLRDLAGRRGGNDRRRIGMSGPPRKVLAVLRNRGPCDCRDLARYTATQPRPVTYTAARLARAGLAAKNKQAGPLIVYTITDAGLERLAEAERES